MRYRELLNELKNLKVSDYTRVYMGGCDCMSQPSWVEVDEDGDIKIQSNDSYWNYDINTVYDDEGIR